MSDGLLYALGEADANMYLCSKELRPSETCSRLCLFYVTLLLAFAHCCSEYYFNVILVIYFLHRMSIYVVIAQIGVQLSATVLGGAVTPSTAKTL